MSIRRQSIYLSLLGLCAGGAAAAADVPAGSSTIVDSGELTTITITRPDTQSRLHSLLKSALNQTS